MATIDTHDLRAWRRGCRCSTCCVARADYDRSRPRQFARIAPDDRCAVDGCGQKVYSRKADPDGLCQSHHKALRRFGTVEGVIQARFNALVDKAAGADACWLWLGFRDDGGYGRFNHGYAHRWAYEFENGPIPAGMEIDHHSCFNRGCVNPRHLRLTMRKQNGENRFGADRDSRTGVRGVTKVGHRYRAAVVHLGKYITAGTFDTIDEAAEAARGKRLELFTHNNIDRMVG